MEEPRNDTKQVVEVLNKILVAIQSLKSSSTLAYASIAISLLSLLVAIYMAARFQSVGIRLQGP